MRSRHNDWHHEANIYALFDSGAAPIMASPGFPRRLGLMYGRTKMIVTVANGMKSRVVGKVLNVPVKFEDLETHVDFVVLKHVLFDVVVGRPTLKKLGEVLDFRFEEVCFAYRGVETIFPLVLNTASDSAAANAQIALISPQSPIKMILMQTSKMRGLSGNMYWYSTLVKQSKTWSPVNIMKRTTLLE